MPCIARRNPPWIGVQIVEILTVFRHWVFEFHFKRNRTICKRVSFLERCLQVRYYGFQKRLRIAIEHVTTFTDEGEVFHSAGVALVQVYMMRGVIELIIPHTFLYHCCYVSTNLNHDRDPGISMNHHIFYKSVQSADTSPARWVAGNRSRCLASLLAGWDPRW